MDLLHSVEEKRKVHKKMKRGFMVDSEVGCANSLLLECTSSTDRIVFALIGVWFFRVQCESKGEEGDDRQLLVVSWIWLTVGKNNRYLCTWGCDFFCPG